MTIKPWNVKKINGKYVYDYPENREIGLQLKGAYSYIAKKLLKKEFTAQYVAMVFRGKRQNNKIMAAGRRYLKSLHQTQA